MLTLFSSERAFTRNMADIIPSDAVHFDATTRALRREPQQGILTTTELASFVKASAVRCCTSLLESETDACANASSKP